MRYSPSFLISAIVFSGCGSKNEPTNPDQTTTSTTTTTPEPAIPFPELYAPLLQSPSFLKPLAPVKRIPIRGDFVEYLNRITEQYRSTYHSQTANIVFGMEQNALYDNTLARFNLIMFSKRNKPPGEASQQLYDLDVASVYSANPAVFQEALDILSTVWGLSVGEIDAFEPTNFTDIVQAVYSRLKSSEVVIALESFSAKGGLNYLTYDPDFYHVQSLSPS